MSKRRQLFTVLITSLTAFVLCFALAGCSSSGGDNNASTGNSAASSSSSNSNAAFVGEWDLVSLKYPSGTVYDSAELEQMGIDYSITLNADGTAEYKITNMDVNITWKVDSPSSITLIFDEDEELTLVLENGELVGDNDETMTYYYAKDKS